MPNYYLKKFQNLRTDYYTALLKPAMFRATPFEGQGSPVNVNPVDDVLSVGDNIWTPTDPTFVNTYRSQLPGLGSRTDFKFLGASASGNGWTFNWQVRGSSSLFSSIKANRGIGMFEESYQDYNNTIGECTANSQVIRGFIRDDGGNSTQMGTDGVDIANITACTPDYFIGKSIIPRLPYMLLSVVAGERGGFSSRSRSVASLGFVPAISGGPPFTVDPYAGFGNHFDAYTESPGLALMPQPANELHFLFECSIVHALTELLYNHCLVSRGSGFSSIVRNFDVDIKIEQSKENDVVAIDLGSGSINDAILEATKQGNWRYWWDSNSNMHFQPDYCTQPYVRGGHVDLLLTNGASLTGDLNVTLGASSNRVNRVAVQGQWSSTFENGMGALDNFTYNQQMSQALYPRGQHLGLGGDDVSVDGYVGKDVKFMAATEYARQSQRTTATLSGFPYSTLAFSLFNRKVGICLKDPMGSFDWTEGATSDLVDGLDTNNQTYGSTGKWFSVDGVSIEIQDPDGVGGGYPVCSLQMTEIIPIPVYV